MVCPNELVALISGAAIAISEGKSPEEIAVLATVFTQLGDTLATLLAMTECQLKCCENKKAALDKKTEELSQ